MLRKLYLSGTQITDAGLVHLKTLAGLQTLCIHGTKVGDLGIQYIKDLSTLRFLCLHDTQVGDVGIGYIKELKQLRTLKLYRTRVTDAGLESLKDLSLLTYLDLEETQITDAGLEHIGNLISLECLYLTRTNVTDTGLAHLKNLSNLRYLYLRDTKISDKGLANLAGLTSLHVLDLLGTRVTASGQADLKRRLPNCSISAPRSPGTAKKEPENTLDHKNPAFAVFSTNRDKTFSQGIADVLRKANSQLDVLIAPSLGQAIASRAEVLILAMDRGARVSGSIAETLKTRKVIGIGYGAAELFGQLGLEICAGACTHSSSSSPLILSQTNSTTSKPVFTDPFVAFTVASENSKGEEMDLDFAMHIPEKSHLRSVVDVIARSILPRRGPGAQDCASIVRQGNCILIGLAAHPKTWTPKYCEFWRQLCLALYSRPIEPFSRAQWQITLPGTYEFRLAPAWTEELSEAVFYFKFSTPTVFSAHVEHKGSNAIMLFFGGGKSIRRDAGQGEPLEIVLDIGKEDISFLGDRYWKLEVVNFDRKNAADCALNIRYDSRAAEQANTGSSTMDTAKVIVSRLAVERRTSQSTDTSPGQGDALPSDESNSHSYHLIPIHRIMGTIVNYYRPIRITLSDQPGEELHKEPKYGAERPLYGTMQLGDGEDRFVTIVVDEPEGGPERIYIDRNNDEDLTNDGEEAWSASSSSSLRLSDVKIDVDYRTGQLPYTFTFYRFKTRLRNVVLYYRDSARQGEIVSSGKTYKIAMLDENADGRFDDLDNGTLLIDLNQDGKLVGRSDSAERHELNKPFNVHGKVWSIDTMSADGSTMVLKPSMAEPEMRVYLEPGYPAPAFSGKDLEGNSIELSKEARLAKYVLLDFWASWCGPCREEFPYLRRLHAGYKHRGLRILGVNLDSKRNAAQQVAQENGLDYPHVFDGLGWKNAVAVQYRVSAIPQTYLLDSNLNIVAKNLRRAGLEQKIAALLGPANNEAIKAAEARRSESLLSPAESPSRRSSTGSHLIASTSSLTRDGTLDDGFSIYLGVGNVNGPGKVIQLDGAGKWRGMVELPSTPYGLAYDSEQLWAALPGANRVVSIDAQGRVDTVLDTEELKNPISVAVAPGNRDILVADNETDALGLLSRNHTNEYKVIYRGETPNKLQNISVAMTFDGFGLMATDNPRGIYHFPLRVGTSLGAPLLASSGDIAADPTSTRWAVMQPRSLHVLDGAQEVFQLPLPVGYSSYRSGLLIFAPEGKLVVALATHAGVELCVADVSEKTFGSLFRWSGERLVTLAVGQKLDWPIVQ
ncbi:MAG: redoxin domain-containing protein [Sedimentisphaerales bacterium]